MEFEFWPAVFAGLAGGLLMSIAMAMMRTAGLTAMNMGLIEGSMFTARRAPALVIGELMHLVVMSALVIGSLYALLFDWLGTDQGDAWWVGLLLGVVHTLIGGVAMIGVPKVHPRMAQEPGPSTPDDVVVRAPGAFGRNYGPLTPVGFWTVHLMYGLVVGLVYAWLVS